LYCGTSGGERGMHARLLQTCSNKIAPVAAASLPGVSAMD
jgi:hypothetical protein